MTAYNRFIDRRYTIAICKAPLFVLTYPLWPVRLLFTFSQVARRFCRLDREMTNQLAEVSDNGISDTCVIR